MTRARTFRGKLCYKVTRSLKGIKRHDFEMRISVNFDLPPAVWEDVVIHEMIHLKIAFEGIKDRSSHGPVFRRLMSEINKKHNRNIRVSARSADSEKTGHNVETRIKAHYICLARFTDGRLSMAPVARNRIFSMWNMKDYFPQITALKWIGSTDVWFNSYPHIRQPKLYIIKEENLLPHLRGAVLLERKDNMIKIVNRRCSPGELLP